MSHSESQKPTPNITHINRDRALTQWLNGLDPKLDLNLASLAPASSDASFRRYFRLKAGESTTIVMDAPPPQEDCRPFCDVTDRLLSAGVTVPHILAKDIEQGFLLLTDLGRQTYYDQIQVGLPDSTLQAHYRDAIAALVTLQSADTQGLPTLDADRLGAELQLFPEWFVEKYHEVSLTPTELEPLQKLFDQLATTIARQPTVLVHRDFHSPNLIACDDPKVGSNPGVLDYQDALVGPITYDIASLVFDARTTWQEPQQLDWAIRYWEQSRAAGLLVETDFATFHEQYEWAGLQRNLRILGVFARLHLRDNKPAYLNHMPRVLQYVRQVASRYGTFRPLLKLLDRLDGIEPQTRYTF